MAETFELKVHLAQDEETGRWYVAASDIPGLRLEADDPATLMQCIVAAAPELIELNKGEVLTTCLSKSIAVRPANQPALRPSILPVFDSPLELAHA